MGGFIEILFFLAWLYSAGIIIRRLGGRWRSIADLRGGERRRTLLVLIDVKKPDSGRPAGAKGVHEWHINGFGCLGRRHLHVDNVF